nr:hypothetical protein CFP56_20955 [Quercus suber]
MPQEDCSTGLVHVFSIGRLQIVISKIYRVLLAPIVQGRVTLLVSSATASTRSGGWYSIPSSSTAHGTSRLSPRARRTLLLTVSHCGGAHAA